MTCKPPWDPTFSGAFRATAVFLTVVPPEFALKGFAKVYRVNTFSLFVFLGVGRCHPD
jgi:hypothetical protein